MKKKYCSSECYYKSLLSKIKENNKKYYKEKPKHEKVCPVCNKVFSAKNDNRICCKDECRKEYYKQLYIKKQAINKENKINKKTYGAFKIHRRVLPQ